jgi:DNA (cytosine-5)-methyltransferase 1
MKQADPKAVQKALSDCPDKKIRKALEGAIKDDNLDERLAQIGLTREKLAYATIPNLKKNPRYKTLKDFKLAQHNTPVISFFSGAGGLDLGLESAGFSHLAVVEKNRLCCETIKANRPWTVIGPPTNQGDVSDTKQIIHELRKSITGKRFDGLFVGGPPCQPFSIAANQRFSKGSKEFKRTGFGNEKNGNLLFDYITLILEFKPRAFLIENVPGLRDVDGGKQIKKAYDILTKAGYRVNEPLVLESSDYSVPQKRTRLFIIGNRSSKDLILPEKTTEKVPSWSAIKGELKHLQNHEVRKHSATSIARYQALKPGQRDQLGRVDRLDPNLPSKTVIAGGTGGGGRSHLHPFIPRTLSVRECARLQTFPDDYNFIGPSARQFTQVGNAVPPVLGAQLGRSIYESFFKK